MSHQSTWTTSVERMEDGAIIKQFSPSKLATRNAPTPVVAVGTSALDGTSDSRVIDNLCGEASSRGFTCFYFHLPYKRRADDTAMVALNRLTERLRTLVTSTEYAFPPILFAYQLGGLVAQAYVSSYPVSALILDEPTPCEDLALSEPGVADRFPLPFEEFNFEPKFPLLVIGNSRPGSSYKGNRLVREGADYLEVEEHPTDLGNGGCPSDVAAAICWLEEMGF